MKDARQHDIQLGSGDNSKTHGHLYDLDQISRIRLL